MLLLLLALGAGGCATPPPKEMTPVERRQRDNAVGLDLAQTFESKIRFRNEELVTAYLEEIANNLIQSSAELKQSPLVVRLIKQDKSPWRNYALPGNRIYVSAAFLKDVRFENEVAALMALELGHILKRNAVSRATATPDAQPSPRVSPVPRPPDFFGPGGIFDFTDEQYLEGLAAAMELLYSAGYDPRGMAAVMTRYLENPAKSPYPPATLAKLLENTRRIIALRAPLRNPIVRSERFLALQKRMRAL